MASMPKTARGASGLTAKRRRISRGEMTGWLTSLPLVVVLLIIFAYPVFNAARLSLVTRDGSWLGLARYGQLLGDEKVLQSVRYSVLFTVGSVTLHLLFGLAAALMLTNRRRLPQALNAYRSLLVLPWVISLTVTAPMLRLLFNQLGVIDYVLKDLLHVISEPIVWFGDARITSWFLILISGWQGFPIFMILFIGSIQAIPTERYEAAMVDGANRWQGFWHVTLPGIAGTALRLIVLDSIWMWRAFEIVFLLTGGGPFGETTVLSFLIYILAFRSAKLNYSAAIAMLMGLMSIIGTLVLLRIPEPEVAD